MRRACELSRACPAATRLANVIPSLYDAGHASDARNSVPPAQRGVNWKMAYFRISRVAPRKVCELATVWLTQPLKNSLFLRFFAVFPGRRYTRAGLSSKNLPGM